MWGQIYVLSHKTNRSEPIVMRCTVVQLKKGISRLKAVPIENTFIMTMYSSSICSLLVLHNNQLVQILKCNSFRAIREPWANQISCLHTNFAKLPHTFNMFKAPYYEPSNPRLVAGILSCNERYNRPYFPVNHLDVFPNTLSLTDVMFRF